MSSRIENFFEKIMMNIFYFLQWWLQANIYLFIAEFILWSIENSVSEREYISA